MNWGSSARKEDEGFGIRGLQDDRRAPGASIPRRIGSRAGARERGIRGEEGLHSQIDEIGRARPLDHQE
jgi:hypothetical protein